MKNIRLAAAIPAMLFASLAGYDAQARDLWKKEDARASGKGTPAITATDYKLYSADNNEISALLAVAKDAPSTIQLPLADGTMRVFNVRETSMMPPKLAAKYPMIRTYTAVAADDPAVTAKLDMTSYGFHAMIYDGANTAMIDPYDNSANGFYTVHYKRDERATPASAGYCAINGKTEHAPASEPSSANKRAYKTVNGTQLLTYRLALACNHEYAMAATGSASPTIAQVLGKMTTSMNRINGVYERELSVSMVLVDNEDTLIWTRVNDPINGADPYDGFNNLAASCNTINQTTCDNRIGTANYDLGHVFTTGAGGYSDVGCVCRFSDKAKSSTGRPNPVGDGFDIDFVAHEMGHEFGADHTFNNDVDDNCGGDNRYAETAYEPGSGSTLMAYAGICSPDNIQAHSDDYFHAASLREIQDYITTYASACPVKTNTGISPISVPSFAWSYNIPFQTPFELTAPVNANNTDTSVTYCWEEWDLSANGERFVDTREYGPLFRSYKPVKSVTRVFPRIGMVLAGVLSDAGVDTMEGEKAPPAARAMVFRLTARSLKNGYGTFNIPDDSIALNVVNTVTGFKVTSQNKTGVILNGGSTERITWDAVGSDKPPVNTPEVDIYLSGDGGYTWPYHIGRYVNSGTADVTMPNPAVSITNARVKVKGADNVFFNVNSQDFGVAHSEIGDTDISIRPVPVHSVLRISSGNKGLLRISVFNDEGRGMWTGEVNGELDLPVLYWPRGVYFIRFVNISNKRTVKKFVVE